MIKYCISGTLPAPWEDFLSIDENYPNITIMTRAEFDDCERGALDADTPDGWLDIIVDADVICLDIARVAIADALGIENPDDIVVEARGACQAI